jgi:hypothetical protein
MPSDSSTRPSVLNLILMPAVVTLAITVLRLYGELHQWPSPWFSNHAGGGGAIIGISWLPFVFGPYFALKLSRSGSGPKSTGKAIGLALAGIVLIIGGAAITLAPPPNAMRGVGGLLLMAIGVALQFNPWPALAKTLIAYAYAARIPVAIVMFFALRGNWGTHYDALPPNYTGPTSLFAKYVMVGVIPQLVGWIGFTVTIGALTGAIANGIVRRRSPATQVA